MSKRTIPIPNFNPKDTLKDIREKSLNPVIQRVLEVEGNIETVIAPTQQTVYQNVSFDDKTRTLTFTPVGFATEPGKYPVKMVDLNSIVPVQAGIDVKGYTKNTDAGFPGSGEVDNTSDVKFQDAIISKDATDGYANVFYDWTKIVPAYQVDSTVTIEDSISPAKVYNKLEVVGEGGKTYFTHTSQGLKQGTVKINLPLIPSQMTTTVDNASTTIVDVPINKIRITGNVGGTHVNGDELQIDMPTGGGTFTVGYFQGFFNSKDDLDNLKNLVEDRSSAYVRMEVEGVLVYILHMWRGTSSGWIEVTNKPPLIYNPEKSGEPKQAIKSVKWNKDITLSSTGELDLSGLENHDKESQNYLGIFDSKDELDALPGPVENKSTALVRDKDLKSFIPFTYRIGDDTSRPAEWLKTPVEGSLKYVTVGATPAYKPILGVSASSNLTLSSEGLLSIRQTKRANILIKAKQDEDHEEKEKSVKGLHFVDGIFVDTATEDGWAVIKHPQRVITYTDEFETKHNSSVFMGNIFFDLATSSWIGWSEGKGGGSDVKPKWTPIAHRGMSEQVTSLNYRHPKENTPIIDTDDKEVVWGQSGMTYLSKTDPDLPEGLKGKAGAFVKTDVKKNTAASGDPSNEIRVQMCRPDGQVNDITGAWMRSYDTPGAKWNPWVQTSFTQQDLDAHKVDPHAHSNILRYYRTYALFGYFKDIFKQVTGDLVGGLVDGNSMLLADNYGYSALDPHDYLDAPYGGLFNISGILSFSGYNVTEKKPKPVLGRWQVLLRKRTSSTGTDYSPVGHFTYDHTDKAKPYPTLLFEVKDVPLEKHQEVVMNITFDNATELASKQPLLYLVPSRSSIVIEDNQTRAGSYIARSYRLLYGNLDTINDVGVKSHHTVLDDPSSGIRVYGEKVQKVATPMTKHDNP